MKRRGLAVNHKTLVTERLWVQTPAVLAIFHAPFIWIKSREARHLGKLTKGICYK
jgi:hypothetical protein